MWRLACAFVLLSACATAPKPHDVRRTTLIRAPVDAVWQALIAELAEYGWDVATIDRSSGLMATKWLRARPELADCGQASFAGVVVTKVRMNIVVTAADGGTNFTVNTAFQQIRTTGVVDCYSTGEVERTAAEHVAARVIGNASR